MSDLFLTLGRRLRLLQTHDQHTQWWIMDETRFCRCCNHLIVGHDIRITLDDNEAPIFQCPSFKCSGSLQDWEYPQLHL